MSDQVRTDPRKCSHTQNAAITAPSKSGGHLRDVCPLIWCRACGSLWVPKTPTFDKAFERHSRENVVAPVDGVGGVEGYWIHPGTLSIVYV